jgi:sigma-B regulation protein RsbU (phosphoserine phosphatase)
MEMDLQAGRKLQSVLLPSEAPEVKYLEIGIGLRPARQISGDLFDFFEHGEDDVAIAFGDSSGKGAAAALYGALVGGLLRSLAPRRRGPAMLLKALNETLLERKVEAQYVTLLVLRWVASTRTLTMANAGAATPLICRDRKILNPRAEGVPIGLLDSRDYDEVVMPMQQGDMIVLYSDGVSDGQNIRGEEFGTERIGEVMARTSKMPSKQIVDEIFKELDVFTEGTEQFDDQTLIVLKVL